MSEEEERQVAWQEEPPRGRAESAAIAHESLWEEPERAPSLAWSLDIPGLDPALLGL